MSPPIPVGSLELSCVGFSWKTAFVQAVSFASLIYAVAKKLSENSVCRIDGRSMRGCADQLKDGEQIVENFYDQQSYVDIHNHEAAKLVG